MSISFVLMFLTAFTAFPASGRQVCLSAVGDVMLSRGVAQRMRERGFDYPLSGISDVVGSADIGFCNLECVLTDLPRPNSKGFVFRAKPSNAFWLKLAGFDLVSVANNHAFDCGIDGRRETISVLKSAGLTPVSELPVTLDIKDLTIGLLAYDLVDTPLPEGMLETVAELDRLVDVVIVSLHWGVEYTLSPSDWQTGLAHRLADRGADLILGHHPHRVQGIGCYRGTVIVYSMGNCVFDQRDPLGNESVIVLAQLTDHGVRRVTVLPAQITGFRPAMASGPAGEKILASVLDHSERLGAMLIRVHEGQFPAARLYPFRDIVQGIDAGYPGCQRRRR